MSALFALADCNNFYVSCERVFDPSLIGKPVVVLSSNDGCIISRSEEAKKLGILMGTPEFKVRRFLHKHGVAVLSSNYTLYGDMSDRVMATLSRFVSQMEIYSVDEAFLKLQSAQSAPADCEKMRRTVLQWTGIPISIGAAPTKTLAKMANVIAKKRTTGKRVVVYETVEEAQPALVEFPVEDVWGVGESHAWNLKRLGIHTAGQLAETDGVWIKRRMTVAGLRTVWELRGIVCHPLQTHPPPRDQLTVSRTLAKPVSDARGLNDVVAILASLAANRLHKEHLRAGALTLFLETNPFGEGPQDSCSVMLTFEVSTARGAELAFFARKAVAELFRKGFAYKRVGLIVSGLTTAAQLQSTLFDGPEMGSESYDPMEEKGELGKAEFLSKRYTTRWEELPEAFALESYRQPLER